MGDGGQQVEAAVLVAQGLNGLGILVYGDHICRHQAGANVAVHLGAVNLPEAGLNGDGAQLLALVIEQEALSAIFNEGQAVLAESNNLPERS